MRILLVLALLVVVAVVSLFQAYRHYDQMNTAYQSGADQGKVERQKLTGEVDSLKLAIGEQQVAFGDSLVRKDAAGQYLTDSLSDEIAERDSIIKAQKTQQKKQAAAQQAAVTVKKKDEKHAQILAYYKDRCDKLPGDLSDYERRVAFAEIRSETAQKFSISVAELNRIRTENHLNY